jgi:hypothetical protein
LAVRMIVDDLGDYLGEVGARLDAHDKSVLLPGNGTRLAGGAATADLARDGKEPDDAFKRLAGNRCRTGSGKLVEAAAHMRSAEGGPHLAARGENAAAAIAGDLEDAGEPDEMGDRSPDTDRSSVREHRGTNLRSGLLGTLLQAGDMQ